MSEIEVIVLTFGFVKQRRTGQIGRFPCVAPYNVLSFIICCHHVKVGILSINDERETTTKNCAARRLGRECLSRRENLRVKRELAVDDRKLK